jgi:hypothetical protein
MKMETIQMNTTKEGSGCFCVFVFLLLLVVLVYSLSFAQGRIDSLERRIGQLEVEIKR